MISQELQQFIRQEIQKVATANRFQLTSIPRHIHNEIDSPLTFQPILNYIGFVPYDGNIHGAALETILPTGWTVTKNSTGNYTVKHNLGTILYSVVASASQSTNVKVSTVTTANANDVTFTWWDENGVAQDTSFNFVLVQINNKKTTLPTYYTNHT